MLSAEEYEARVAEFAIYPHAGEGSVGSLVYCVLGLNGEAGEVAEKLKKLFRDEQATMATELSEGARQALLLELGDVLWFVTRTATELGLSLEEVAKANIDKLASRAARGRLAGSGDNR